MAKEYFPPAGQLNHSYDDHPNNPRRQNLSTDDTTAPNESLGNHAGERRISTLGSKSLTSSASKQDISLKIPLVAFKPGTIIQGVIFQKL